MRAVANTLIGHALLVVIGGVYSLLVFLAQYYALGWLITNTGWRWVASAFFPIVICIFIPAWMAMMHGLGRAFREAVSNG